MKKIALAIVAGIVLTIGVFSFGSSPNCCGGCRADCLCSAGDICTCVKDACKCCCCECH